MYAPSSYNDTVTGETLSSVSDKSDSYSNDGSQPDLTVNKFCYRRIERHVCVSVCVHGIKWKSVKLVEKLCGI